MDEQRRAEIMARYEARSRQFELVARRSRVQSPLPAPAQGPPRRDLLTAREREALALIACGLSNREIGARLHLTEETIKNHVANLLAKLGASNRAHAVAIAAARGLIELRPHVVQNRAS